MDIKRVTQGALGTPNSRHFSLNSRTLKNSKLKQDIGKMSEPMIDWGIKEVEPSIIKVMGLGGGGGNAVNHMFTAGIKGVDFIVCNTDNQHLLRSPIAKKILIGYNLTSGLGVGGNPEIGKKAAINSSIDIKSALGKPTKMLFITAGMGGGTGTGAAPIIAKIAKDLDLLTVAIVTYPFDYEGPKRKQLADEGIAELNKYVDALIIIHNEQLMEMFPDAELEEAFIHVDNICAIAAKGIAEIITVPGEMNVGFEDVKAIMKDSGTAIFGSATSEGENRAKRAIEAALHSPLLKDKDILGVQNILLNISYGDQKVLVNELRIITDYLREKAGEKVDIKLGYSNDKSLGKKLSVTLIATSFEKNAPHFPVEHNTKVELTIEEVEKKEEQIFEIEVEKENVEDIKLKKFKVSLIPYIKDYFKRLKLGKKIEIWLKDGQGDFSK